MTSEEFVREAVQNKSGKNIGKRSIWFNGTRKNGDGVRKEYVKPQWEKYLATNFDRLKRANKAPEPTPGLVTPRALECVFKMKRRNEKRDAARGAPSPVVAHL